MKPAKSAAQKRGNSLSSLSLTVIDRGQMPTPSECAGWMAQVANNRDAQAFERLFRHFGPRLRHWLAATGSSVQSAEDLAQEAFAALWKKATQFDSSRSTVAAWLFTIAKNLRVDRSRRACESFESLDDCDCEQFASSDPTPEAILLAKQRHERVHWALQQLPSDQFLLFHLAYYADKSQSHIAAELSLPLGTVKTRMRRTSLRLREALSGPEAGLAS